jgi:ribonuclease HII
MNAPRPTPELERFLAAESSVVAIDEVGRGALAGPVVVGAVLVTPEGDPPPGLADSKVLTGAQREALVAPIAQWAPGVALGAASAREIDDWGLRLALAVAIDRAIGALGVAPGHVLLDGNLNLLDAPVTLPWGPPAPPRRFAALPVTTVIRGDATCSAIAAASVLAKVARDETMRTLARSHPSYGWERNKGYGTPEHLAALREFGPSDEHRRSWSLPGPSEPGDGPVGQ